ncbi:hypothetical protein L1049_016859 [Liquidambar formosana]|uniref:Pectinesterase catalytic domain-containing protein n=1 Tax=Liquidambar formosana TaxID=63359 RepID=A0AAP0S285_LIQFO
MAVLGGCKLIKDTFLILPLFLILFTVSAVASSSSSTTFNVTVASNGSGNYKTINEAMAAALTLSESSFVIHIKEGTCSENMEVPSDKTNIVFIGDGSTKTVVTANRSNGTSYGSMDSETLNKY